MDLSASISSIMTTELITLSPNDKLQKAKEIFGTYPLHHILVVEDERLVGILSKADYLYFLKPLDAKVQAGNINEDRLKKFEVREAMTKRLVCIEEEDSIHSALELLSENLFHALPVLNDGDLRGVVTTHDIVYSLLHPKQVMT